MLRLVLVVIAFAALSSCSEESEPPDDYDAGVVRDGLAALFAGDHPEARDTAAGRCFAEKFTDASTPQELRSAGVLDERFDVVAALPSLPPGLAETWVDAQFACTDFVDESTRAQVKVSKGRLDAPAYAACLRDALTEEELRAAVQATLEGRWEAPEVAALADAQAICFRDAMPPDPT